MRGIDIFECLGLMVIALVTWPGITQFIYEITPNIAFELLGTSLTLFTFIIGYLLAYEKTGDEK